MDRRRYIALLRGINISGKNKIPMAELKKEFEKDRTNKKKKKKKKNNHQKKKILY